MLRLRRGATAGLLLASVLTAGGAVAGAASAAGPTVTVRNAGYTPATVTVRYGTKVTWSFVQGTHSVTDASRLGLFNSGPKAPGTTYAYTFIDAGTFGYRSTVGTAIKGSVVVPMTVTPATGSRTTFFAVRWGSDFTPVGYNEQVQIKIPGTTAWQSFVFGTPASNATMRPVDWGNKTGTYQFRAKLFKGDKPAVSGGWSPVAKITVR